MNKIEKYLKIVEDSLCEHIGQYGNLDPKYPFRKGAWEPSSPYISYAIHSSGNCSLKGLLSDYKKWLKNGQDYEFTLKISQLGVVEKIIKQISTLDLGENVV